MKRIASALIFLVSMCTSSAFAAEELKISSTIGPIDAGIVPLLTAEWSKKSGTAVKFEGAGTGATLEKAKTGKFDMVIVHARALEDKFVADGFGKNRQDIMYNDFVILGPKDDPAGIRGMKSAAEAFKKMAEKGVLFLTRGDMSGTHVKEMEVWAASKIKPAWDKYKTFSLGHLGNRPTTEWANKENAYLLMDRATVLTMGKNNKLDILSEGDPILRNNIAVIAVNPDKFPKINATAAAAFIDWVTGDEAQTLIKNFGVEKYKQPLFFPNSDKWNQKNK